MNNVDLKIAEHITIELQKLCDDCYNMQYFGRSEARRWKVQLKTICVSYNYLDCAIEKLSSEAIHVLKTEIIKAKESYKCECIKISYKPNMRTYLDFDIVHLCGELEISVEIELIEKINQ